MTYTYTVLDVSQAVYAAVRALLDRAAAALLDFRELRQGSRDVVYPS